MSRRGIGTLLTVVASLLSAGDAPAEEADRISNWTVAPYWSGPEAAPSDARNARDANPSRTGTAGGRHALAVGPLALPFIALPPCRLVDTRGNGAPLQGGFLPPATVRNYTLTGVCGVPSNAQAISLNATAVNPTGPGFLVLYPQGGTFPPVSTLNYLGGDVIVNAAVVPLSAAGGISVALGVSGGDVLLDTNGYYATVPAVNSLNTQTGDLTLVPGTNVTITPGVGTLTIAATAGGGGVSSVAGTNGISASPATGAVTVTSNATSANTPSTIVSRDGTGFFAAGSVTLSGALNLPTTNAALTAGVLRINGSTFLHSFGGNNTWVGSPAGNGTMTGGVNTAVGSFSITANTTGFNLAAFGSNTLDSNTTGNFNSAFGSVALHLNSTGSDNSAFGTEALANNTVSGNSAFGRAALRANTSGIENTAVGNQALLTNATGNRNTAMGSGALQSGTNDADNTAVGRHALTANSGGGSNTAVGVDALAANITGGNNVAMGRLALSASTGSNNIAIGQGAGSNLSSGGNNIYIGATGNATESNTIRVGTGQTSAFMDGVSGQTSAGGVGVFINGSGKLGTTTSSKRYKEDIVEMDSESDVLMRLRPVSFVYTPDLDPSRTPQFGLIAEEVAEVAPQLAVFDKDGRPETVRYHFVNAMLLNEVQKSRRLIDELRAESTELRADRAELMRRLDAIEQRLSRAIDRRPN